MEWNDFLHTGKNSGNLKISQWFLGGCGHETLKSVAFSWADFVHADCDAISFGQTDMVLFIFVFSMPVYCSCTCWNRVCPAFCPSISLPSFSWNWIICFFWISAQIPYMLKILFLRYRPKCSQPVRLQGF